MSRDWTPFENFIYEQSSINRGFGDIFDFMENSKWVFPDSPEKPLHSPEEMAIRRQFPCLGKYLMKGFHDLYERLEAIEGGIELLHQKDVELAAYISAREYKITERSPEEIIVHSKPWQGNSESYLVRWFVGELDPNFHFSERNDELFIECILHEAKSLVREAFDPKSFEAALQRYSCDVDTEANLDYFKSHPDKLIYCYENKKDLIDFDFWVRYELLLGEKLTWDEYVAIDNKFDGDPHDVELSNKRTINTFRTSLKRFRNAHEEKPSLEDNVRDANDRKVKLQSGDCRGVGDVSLERD